MAEHSKIEWTNSSWNPIRARNLRTGKVGWHCEHATTGCEFCYAETMNRRLGTDLPFKPGHRKDIEIFLDEEMLTAPLRWKKPRMIFVCSMTDLFADFVDEEWIDKMFAVMALCPQHTFQMLTKRAERMRAYLSGSAIYRIAGRVESMRTDTRAIGPLPHLDGGELWWPLRNVWLGVSAERQKEADERVPALLETPAAVRFVSAEPLLGPIDLTSIKGGGYVANSLARSNLLANAPLDWIIVGGESGQNARPMHPNWARAIRDQCQAAGVPFFFKQWGEHVPGELDPLGDAEEPCRIYQNGSRNWRVDEFGKSKDELPAVVFSHVGKKTAGRLLDGREHNEFPVRR